MHASSGVSACPSKNMFISPATVDDQNCVLPLCHVQLNLLRYRRGNPPVWRRGGVFGILRGAGTVRPGNLPERARSGALPAVSRGVRGGNERGIGMSGRGVVSALEVGLDFGTEVREVVLCQACT